MQTWVVPCAPKRDGWHIWYATDGSSPKTPQVLDQGRVIDSAWTLAGPYQVQGFERSIFLGSITLPAASVRHPHYDIFIPDTGETYRWQLLPDSLPPEGMSFVFGSCFWQQDDAEGALLSAMQDILKLEHPRPSFKILLGDQIYLDWPADVAPWRLRRGGYRLVGDRYARYWGDDAYRRFLAAVPNIVVPDDHEFWNDFPESQVQLPITWMPALRDDFAQAAREYYRLFQGLLNQDAGKHPWSIVSLPPVSIFVADTRSERSPVKDRQHSIMSKEQWEALESWQHSLVGPGLLAIGQPVFQRDGDWRDHSLSNFAADYRRLLALLKRSAVGDNKDKTAHNIVLLSGDIHSARSTYANIPGVSDADFNRQYELVASASSAIGPHITTPSPSPLPDFLPEGNTDRDYDPRWPVNPVTMKAPADVIANNGPYACVDNNLGVVRLKPASVSPYAVELSYLSYRVRPYRRPYLQLGSNKRAATEQAGRLIYTQTLNLR